MKFIKLNSGSLVNLSLIQEIALGYGRNDVNYHMSSGMCTYEYFNTEQEAQERFEEIQKLLGVEV